MPNISGNPSIVPGKSVSSASILYTDSITANRFVGQLSIPQVTSASPAELLLGIRKGSDNSYTGLTSDTQWGWSIRRNGGTTGDTIQCCVSTTAVSSGQSATFSSFPILAFNKVGELACPKGLFSTSVDVSGNVSCTGFVNTGISTLVNVSSSGIGTFISLTGTLLTANQPNITGLGTLLALNVSGITTSTSGFSGTLLTASQSNITRVGILTSLSVSGVSTLTNVSVTGISTLAFLSVSGISTLANVNVTGISTLASLSVTGITTSTGGFSGTLLTASQPNITGVGTLSALIVNGKSILGTTNVGRYVEIDANSANTSYIDFHSLDGSNVDYDSRVIATSGTSGVAGKGALTIQSDHIDLPNITQSGTPIITFNTKYTNTVSNCNQFGTQTGTGTQRLNFGFTSDTSQAGVVLSASSNSSTAWRAFGTATGTWSGTSLGYNSSGNPTGGFLTNGVAGEWLAAVWNLGSAFIATGMTFTNVLATGGFLIKSYVVQGFDVTGTTGYVLANNTIASPIAGSVSVTFNTSGIPQIYQVYISITSYTGGPTTAVMDDIQIQGYGATAASCTYFPNVVEIGAGYATSYDSTTPLAVNGTCRLANDQVANKYVTGGLVYYRQILQPCVFRGTLVFLSQNSSGFTTTQTISGPYVNISGADCFVVGSNGDWGANNGFFVMSAVPLNGSGASPGTGDQITQIVFWCRGNNTNNCRLNYAIFFTPMY